MKVKRNTVRSLAEAGHLPKLALGGRWFTPYPEHQIGSKVKVPISKCPDPYNEGASLIIASVGEDMLNL